MESRMVKFYSKESNMVAIHAIPGHFATSHSHINYYIDITSLKTILICGKEAKANRQQSLLFRSKRNMVEMFISLCYTIIRI